MTLYAKKHGFALVMTMMMTSLIIMITTFISYRATMFLPYAKIAIHQQKARQLALGGIQLAISQLSEIKESEETQETPNTKNKKQDTKLNDTHIAKKLIQSIIPLLGIMQSVPLKKHIDGINGSIQFCITSEHGKINLNQLYDFEKHQFIDDSEKISEDQKKKGSKQLLVEIFDAIQKTMGGKSLFESFEKFLKQRQYRLDDITELLTAPGFDIFKDYVFYAPLTTSQESKESKPLYLADLFTLESGSKTVEPWLLSDSMRGALGMSRVVPESSEKKESAQDMMQETLKAFSLSTDWKQQWDKLLSPRYKKEYSGLSPAVVSHLSTKFEPKIFSVVSYGTFAQVTQRLYAILERTVEKTKDDVVMQVRIKKIYWL